MLPCLTPTLRTIPVTIRRAERVLVALKRFDEDEHIRDIDDRVNVTGLHIRHGKMGHVSIRGHNRATLKSLDGHDGIVDVGYALRCRPYGSIEYTDGITPPPAAARLERSRHRQDI